MAARGFRGFPSHDELADRIEMFMLALQRGHYQTALTLCPIETIQHAVADDDELEAQLNQRCNGNAKSLAAQLGKVRHEVEVSPRWDAHHGNAFDIVARHADSGVTGFVLASSHGDDRWVLWFQSLHFDDV
jgi:hypothetical protein